MELCPQLAICYAFLGPYSTRTLPWKSIGSNCRFLCSAKPIADDPPNAPSILRPFWTMKSFTYKYTNRTCTLFIPLAPILYQACCSQDLGAMLGNAVRDVLDMVQAYSDVGQRAGYEAIPHLASDLAHRHAQLIPFRFSRACDVIEFKCQFQTPTVFFASKYHRTKE
jgi:hypothetical protein